MKSLSLSESFSEAQNKRHQKTLDEERRRVERFLDFKREEAEKDRQHELRLAQMLSANVYHARAFLFQPETSQKIVSESNQSFHTSVFPRQQFSSTYNQNPESPSNFQ